MKVAVFLDFANISATSSSLRCKVDYGSLLNYLADDSENRELLSAYVYVPIDPRQEHAMDDMIAQLWDNGYIVRSKIGTMAGDTYKCNFDVEMTLDMSRIAYENNPDIIVLVSGDSDFIPVVLDLREKGIRVEVASFSRSLSRQLSHRCSGTIILDSLIDDYDSEDSYGGNDSDSDFDGGDTDYNPVDSEEG